MALCNVTGTLYLPNGQLGKSLTLRFRRSDQSVKAEYLGAVVPHDVYTQSDKSGQVDFEILTGVYVMHVEGGYSVRAIVPDDATADIADCIDAAAIPDQPPVWYQQALDARDEAQDAADRAEDAASQAAGAVVADYFVATDAERLALSPSEGETAYVSQTGHTWKWQSGAWVDMGVAPFALSSDVGDLRAEIVPKLINIGGTADAITADPPQGFSAGLNVTGAWMAFIPTATNTVAGPTLKVGAGGFVRTLYTEDGSSALPVSALVPGAVHVLYNTANNAARVVGIITPIGYVGQQIAPLAAAVSQVGDSISQQLSAPSLRRSTEAGSRVYDLIDMVGGLHLPHLGGRSVQEHILTVEDSINRLARRIATLGETRPARVIDAVADLGCDPTGVESVSAKMQAAINALSESASGPAAIYMPRGYYRTTAAIVPKPGVSIIGYSRDRVVFLPTGVEAAFEFKGGGGNFLTNCVFANFSVDGQNQTLSSLGNYNVSAKAFYIQRFRDCLFTDILMQDTGATSMGIDFADRSIIQRVVAQRGGRLATVGDLGGSGIGIGTGELAEEPLLIVDCITEYCRNYGIFLERQIGTNAMRTIIAQTITRYNQWGIGDCGTRGTIIAQSQVANNISHGITIHRGTNNASHAGSRTLISNNQIHANGGAGIDFDAEYSPQRDTHAYSSQGNRIEGNAEAGHKIRGPAVGGTHTRRELTIDGDIISGNGGPAVDVVGGRLDYLKVANTQMIENTGPAMRLEGDIRTGRIFGNSMWDNRATKTQTGSIEGGAALTDVDISENHGVGCAPMNLTGAQTRVTLGRNQGM